MTPVGDGEQLLTTREVAELLGVSPGWVLRRQEELGGIRLSSKVLRFPKSGVTAYLERHRVGREQRVVGLRAIASDDRRGG